MNNKKVVFVLLILLVSTGLITFIINKSRSLQKSPIITASDSKILINNQEYEVYKTALDRKIINVSDNINFSDVIKNFEFCTIQAGIPLIVEQVDSALFKIKELSPLKAHLEVSLKEGDVLIGQNFIASKKDVGQKGELLVLNPDQTTKKVSFIIQAWLSCR